MTGVYCQEGATCMLTIGQESSPPIEIDIGSELWTMTFSADGEHIVCGNADGIQVWRVEDGPKRTARMRASLVNCLAVSKDNRWIAAGTYLDGVMVWNAKTYERVFWHQENDNIHAVDFSPNSTQLVSASHGTAIIRDLTTGRPAQTLRHDSGWVIAAKYSPKGDRIATATEKSVRIWDSHDGRLLLSIEVKVTPQYNTGILWLNNLLFVVSDSTLKQFDASTGLAITEWLVPSFVWRPCIALPSNGKFIAYSAKTTVTFWDTYTHAQLDLLQYPQVIFSIAISAGDQFVAVGGRNGKISIKSLSCITDSIPISRLHPTFQEPDIRIDDAALHSWEHDQLEDAEALLTASIINSRNVTHPALASRALVRARSQQWDTALADAEMAINIQPSVLGYIAKSVAHIGNGERDKAYRTCDIAFERFHTSHMTFLLLIKAIIVCMAGDYIDAIARVDDLISMVPFNPMCFTVQTYMYLLLGDSHMERGDYEGAIQSFERAQTQMRHYGNQHLRVVSLTTGWKFGNLGITIRQGLCEALYAAGRIRDAGKCLLKMVNTFGKVYTSAANVQWVVDFTDRYLSAPKSDGDTTSKAVRHDEATIFRATLNSLTPTPLLWVWAKASLTSRSWTDSLVAATYFVAPRFTIYRVMCEYFATIDRITDAIECFQKMVDELVEETSVHNEKAAWVVDFKHRCSGKLEILGDAAMSVGRHHDAISHYSAALGLDPTAPQGLFTKRSKAHIAGGLWEAALNDANKVIEFDPLSPCGYDMKHAALHEAGDYENATSAFETMLAKVSQSSDVAIRERYRQHVNPGEARVAVRRAVQDAIRDLPRVLINTVSGRLLDKSEQAAAFESLPVFNKLVSSTTTSINHTSIEHDVTEYYRYAMFSHKWEGNEPLFEKVMRMVVYDLEESHTHDKLQMFCKIVRDEGLHWAWSDTCCINKADHFVLQEALVAMFKWYRGSALTLVLLRGVRSPSRRGALVKSIWNTRAWTFQEYHASRVVRFYNEDWTLYRNLDITNHKESPEIISEMEEATSVSARALMALRPGLDDIREKLCLASTRQTTLVEDAAYSLLGIFSMSLPIVYGEGDQALGRLLAQLLTNSGDTSILAWTGRSGSFNSCLPANIIVFKELPTSHIPSATPSTETEMTTARPRSFSLNLTSATKLHDRLHELPVPMFVGKRMKLPCLAFKLGPVSATESASGHVFRAKTDALGTVEITTTEDLSRLNSLVLVHPWIDFLLDRQPVGSVIETTSEQLMEGQSSSIGEPPSSPGPSNITSTISQSRTARLASRFRLSFGARSRDAESLLSPSSVSPADKRTQALQLVARLRQPFGALLLTPTRQNVAEYRRVASESLITVRVQEDTPLNVLIASAQMLDVL